MKPLIIFLALLANVSALKFLVYNPMWGRSHVTFMGKLCDALIDAGHNVTMIGPVLESRLGTFGTEKAKIIKIPQCESSREFEYGRGDEYHSNLWRSKSVIGTLKEIMKSKMSWIDQCNATLHHEHLVKELKDEKFDGAFTEPMDLCSFGIFHLAEINNIAITLSMASFEGSFELTGLPSFPSYVPGTMAAHSEKMSFFQRIINTLSILIVRVFFPRIAAPYQTLFRSIYGEKFPDLFELAANNSLVFLNDEPLIEFPRPTLHKIIDIGGITTSHGHKPLNQTWSDIMNLRKYTVLFSLGTVAKSYLMPDEYKNTLRDTFKRFPQVTFIWKYEKPEHNISEGIDNVIESTWIPQMDMLHDSRLSLFITHCGQGSTTEATTAGVPLIVIPVLGDQMRNAQVIKRINTGIVLKKTDLLEEGLLETAIREILNDPSYKTRALQVGETIRNRPFSPQETFVKNMEFMAKYGPLRQLDHYGRQLNFFQYYLIDVFLFLTICVLILFFISWFIFISLLRSLRFCLYKEKQE